MGSSDSDALWNGAREGESEVEIPVVFGIIELGLAAGCMEGIAVGTVLGILLGLIVVPTPMYHTVYVNSEHIYNTLRIVDVHKYTT